MKIFPTHLIKPVNLSILSFTGLILLGTVLLMLPAASEISPLSPIDALFTATSATCVTGLLVVDTNSYLSTFGQWVVLILIQVGALGIMTFSTIIILLMSGRISFLNRITVQESFAFGPDTQLPALIISIVKFTFILEAIGASLLYFRFSNIYTPCKALYYSIFHSVSAFCNAGFCLYHNSLIGFQNDPLVCFTICFLIISGGFGFLVLKEIKNRFSLSSNTKPHHVSVHSKIVLLMTGIMLSVGTLVFLIFEWNCSLNNLSIPTKFLTAFFQSVTARTAGFNTVDFRSVTGVTLFFVMFLMFVGAASGSTGGGIKINTLSVLIALGRSRLQGEQTTNIFRRTLTKETIARAVAVILISLLLVFTGAILLMISEIGNIPYHESRGLLPELIFEVVSAFGTVGLSLGVTSKLSIWGKIIIIFMMFIGRLGPLTIAMALVKSDHHTHIQYADENVMIG